MAKSTPQRPPYGHRYYGKSDTIPSFNSIYQGLRAIRLWEHRLNVRVVDLTPARSMDLLIENLESDLKRWSMDARGVFKGRRYGAGRRMMADLNRGKRKMATMGRG